MNNFFKKLLPGKLGHQKDSSIGTVNFELSHKNFPIGYLHFQNDKWVFEYSEKFKEQKTISPIIDFPEVNKVYESEDLWPYFASRIPSSNSPHIKRKIQMNDLDESSIVEMLKVFGRNSISSPFSLRFMI